MIFTGLDVFSPESERGEGLREDAIDAKGRRGREGGNDVARDCFERRDPACDLFEEPARGEDTRGECLALWN